MTQYPHPAFRAPSPIQWARVILPRPAGALSHPMASDGREVRSAAGSQGVRAVRPGRPRQQRYARLYAMPWRGARRMRQWDQIESPPGVANFIFAPNNLIQPWRSQKLAQRQSSHRDDQFGFENFQFAF